MNMNMNDYLNSFKKITTFQSPLATPISWFPAMKNIEQLKAINKELVKRGWSDILTGNDPFSNYRTYGKEIDGVLYKVTTCYVEASQEWQMFLGDKLGHVTLTEIDIFENGLNCRNKFIEFLKNNRWVKIGTVGSTSFAYTPYVLDVDPIDVNQYIEAYFSVRYRLNYGNYSLCTMIPCHDIKDAKNPDHLFREWLNASLFNIRDQHEQCLEKITVAKTPSQSIIDQLCEHYGKDYLLMKSTETFDARAYRNNVSYNLRISPPLSNKEMQITYTRSTSDTQFVICTFRDRGKNRMLEKEFIVGGCYHTIQDIIDFIDNCLNGASPKNS